MSDGAPDYSMFSTPATTDASAQTAPSTGPDYSMFAVPTSAPVPSSPSVPSDKWSGPEQFTLKDVRDAAKAAGADPDLYASVIYHGEKSTARSVSPKGALGAAQLMPATANDLGVNPYDTTDNLKGGALLLAQLLDRYKGDKAKAVAAYNAGPGAVDQAGGIPNFPETQAYVQRVLKDGKPVEVADTALPTPVPAGSSAEPDDDSQAITYDPNANVTRRADGSIVSTGHYLGQSGGVSVWQGDGSTDAEDIAAYLKAHPNDPANHIAPTPVEAKDTLSRLGAGTVQGLQNVGETFQNAAAASARAVPVLGRLENALGYNPQAAASSAMVNRLQSDQAYANSPAYGVGRFLGETIPTIPAMVFTDGLAGLAGRGLVETAPGLSGTMDFLGGASTGALKIPSQMAQGAIQGAQVGALTSGGNDQSLRQNVAQGALGGAILNPVVNRFLHVPSSLVGGGASPGVTDLADKAVNQYGIQPTVDQIKAAMGDRTAAIRASNDLSRPETGVPAQNAANLDQLMKGFTRSYGDESGDISPEALSANRSRLGDKLGAIARSTNINNTDPLMNRLGQIAYDASQYVPDDELKPVQNLIQHIGSTITPSADGGPASMSGEAYANLIKKGGTLDKALGSSNSSIRDAASDIKSALDDAFEAAASPEVAQDFRNTRFQYKNLMTIAKISPKADANGVVSPALLRGAIATQFKNQAFQGAGPLGDLSAIYQNFLKEPPNSGTAARLADLAKHSGLTSALGIGGGLGLEAALHQPLNAVGALAGGAALAGAQTGSDIIRGALNRSAAMRNLFLHGLPIGATGNRLINAAGVAGQYVAPVADTGLMATFPPAANNNVPGPQPVPAVARP